MTRLRASDATAWITKAVLAHPHDLSTHVQQRLGCDAESAAVLLDELQTAQWIQRAGEGPDAPYEPGLLRQVTHQYNLEGLQEDIPWQRDFLPMLRMRLAVLRIVQHVFSELVNNAIDHSGGQRVKVSLRQTPTHVHMLVSDDGRGLFQGVSEDFGIEEPAQVALELCKGKLTSLPRRHTGRGLFYIARLADVFDVHANTTAFQRRGWEEEHTVRVRANQHEAGTSVFFGLALDTPRRLDDVMRQASLDGQGFALASTRVPVSLLTREGCALESRAQARRISLRLDKFKRAELDFSGLDEVGHAFTDELFRVLSDRHPDTELVPINMAPRVAEMVAFVQSEIAAEGDDDAELPAFQPPQPTRQTLSMLVPPG